MTTYKWLLEVIEGGQLMARYACQHKDGHNDVTANPYKAYQYETEQQAHGAATSTGEVIGRAFKAVLHGFDDGVGGGGT